MKTLNNMDSWLKDGLGDMEASFSADEMQADWEQVQSAIGGGNTPNNNVEQAASSNSGSWLSGITAKITSTVLVATVASTITYYVVDKEIENSPESTPKTQVIDAVNLTDPIVKQDNDLETKVETYKNFVNNKIQTKSHKKSNATKANKNEASVNNTNKVLENEHNKYAKNKNISSSLLISDTKICVGESLELSFFGDERLLVKVQQNGVEIQKVLLDQDFTTSFNKEGEVILEIMNADEQDIIATYKVYVLKKPEANFNLAFSDNQRLMLANTSIRALSYDWIINNSTFTSFEPEPLSLSKIGNNGDIMLIAYNQACSDTITRNINEITDDEIVDKQQKLSLPNVFTPNGDKRNDELRVVYNGQKIKEYKWQVYDRNGSLVFSANSLDMAWNGKENNTGKICPAGTYIYVIEYMEDNKLAKKEGFIFLAR